MINHRLDSDYQRLRLISERSKVRNYPTFNRLTLDACIRRTYPVNERMAVD